MNKPNRNNKINNNNKTKKNKKTQSKNNLYNFYMGLSANMDNTEIIYSNDINNIIEENDIKITKFHLQNGPYIFNGIEKEYSDIIEIKFYIQDENKKDDICVKITVPKKNNKIPGNVDTLYYDKECSISSVKLERKEGTIIMLKTALEYVSDKFPYVKEYMIQDETHVNDEKLGKPLITSKRLLLGRPGWYQEFFGAEPTDNTTKLIEQISEKRVNINKLIKKYKPKNIGDEWFIPSNITLILDNIPAVVINDDIYNIGRHIFGTSWKITKETISKYNMDYNILDENIGETHNNYYKNYVNIHERTSSNNKNCH